MWSLKYADEHIYKTKTARYKEQTWACQGEYGVGEGRNWGLGLVEANYYIYKG